LGQELVVNGDFSDGLNGWLQTGSVWQASNGSVEKTSGSSFLYQTNVAGIGTTVLVSFDILNISGGTVAISLSDGGTTATFNSIGRKTLAGKVTKNASIYFSGDLGALITISNISIRRADGYGTIINGNASDWGLFDKQADGDWLGQELSTISETPLLGDDSDPEFDSTLAVLLSGSKYLISAEFETNGSAGVGCGWSTSGGVPGSSPFRLSAWSVGDQIGGVFDSSSSQSPTLFGRGGLGMSKYKDVSVKEVLKNA